MRCLCNKDKSLKRNRHPWEWTNGVGQRTYANYVSLFMGKMILIVSDAFLKWIETFPVYNSTSKITILKLCTLFSRYNLPFLLVIMGDASRVKNLKSIWLACLELEEQ